jgi:hypothetical protein
MLNLDGVVPTKSQIQRTRRRLRRSILIALVVDLFILALGLFILAFYWASTYNWAIFLKGLHVVRVALLFSAYCSRINPLEMVGGTNQLKLLKVFSQYAPLHGWIIVGWLDLVVFRVPLLPVDLLVLSLTGSFLSLRQLLFVSLDVWLIFEFFLSNYLVYRRGVEGTLRAVYCKGRRPRHAAFVPTGQTGYYK